MKLDSLWRIGRWLGLFVAWSVILLFVYAVARTEVFGVIALTGIAIGLLIAAVTVRMSKPPPDTD